MRESAVKYDRERITFINAVEALKIARIYNPEISGYEAYQASDSLWRRGAYRQLLAPDEAPRQEYFRKMGGFVELALEFDTDTGVDQQG